MVLHKISVDVVLTEMNCGECGGTYAINERYRQQKYDKGGGWHCPYCQCTWGYFDNNEVSRLEKQLASEKRKKETAIRQKLLANEETQRTKNHLRAEKAAKTRLKNRIAKGVCPCCTRHFTNLERHMETKHPDYAAT